MANRVQNFELVWIMSGRSWLPIVKEFCIFTKNGSWISEIKKHVTSLTLLLCSFSMCSCSIQRIFWSFEQYLTSESTPCFLSRLALFAGAAISIGGFLYQAVKTRERSIIYLRCLTLACFLMFSTFVVNDLFSSFIDSYTAHLMLKVSSCMHTLQWNSSYNLMSLVTDMMDIACDR